MVNASIITSAGRQKPNDIAVFGMQGAQKRTGTDVLGMGFFHTAFRNRPVNPDKDPKREMDDSEWPSGKRLGERGDRPVNIGKSSDFEHPLENRKSRGSASKKKGSASETKGLVVLEIVGNNDREPIIDLSLKGKDPKKEIRYVKDKIAVANLVAEVRSMTYAEALKNPKQEGVDCIVVSLHAYPTYGNYKLQASAFLKRIMDKYNPPKLIILRSHLDVDTVNEDGIPCFAPSPYSPKETKALRALDSMKNVHSITPCFEHNDWLKMLLK